MSMQRADLRDKYHLRGSCATDIATACCCVLCDLVQQEKESEHREPLVSGPAGGVQQGYQMQGGMAYPAAPAPAAAGAGPPASSAAPVAQQGEKGPQEGTTVAGA